MKSIRGERLRPLDSATEDTSIPTPNAAATTPNPRGPAPRTSRDRNTSATLSMPAKATPMNSVTTTARATA